MGDLKTYREPYVTISGFVPSKHQGLYDSADIGEIQPMPGMFRRFVELLRVAPQMLETKESKDG